MLQEGFSATKTRKATAAPVVDEAGLRSSGGGTQLTTPGPAAPQLQLQTGAKRPASRKSTEAVQASPPPPAADKYPHLTAVKDMFWNTLEDINRASANGKLATRAARNAVHDVLANGEFWDSLRQMLQRRAKATNDVIRADRRIRTSNALTAAVTSPMAVEGFQQVVNEVYNTVSGIRSDVGVDALRLMAQTVDDGSVSRGLGAVADVVDGVNLNPGALIRGFAMFRKALNLCGATNMTGDLSRSLMSFSSRINH